MIISLNNTFEFIILVNVCNKNYENLNKNIKIIFKILLFKIKIIKQYIYKFIIFLSNNPGMHHSHINHIFK